ncbi:MAG: hypothetical protein WD468_03155 [Pirellulales bacterium]
MTILTSSTLLVHVLVGCCRHCDPTCALSHVAAATSSRTSGCCDHGHKGNSDRGHQPAQPCKCKLECKSVCISLPPERVLLDESHTVLPLESVSTAANVLSRSIAEVANCIVARTPPELEPPLRLHLVYQLLLI